MIEPSRRRDIPQIVGGTTGSVDRISASILGIPKLSDPSDRHPGG